MTRVEAIHRVCQLAYAQVGYHEGANNYNKYAADARVQRLYGWNVQNQPWCCVFVNYCFIESFGYEDGTALTYGGSAACAVSAQLFKNNNAWSTNPRKGDQIFFKDSNGINHTGIVVDVSGATITTVEGNYSDSVSKNTYYVHDSRIAGFGVPNWSLVARDEEPQDQTTDENTDDIVHPMHYRSCYHLQFGDGCKSHGQKPLTQVKAWQELLICWGFDVGSYGVDGKFGDDTKTATELWQEKAKALGADVEVNGIVDSDDWEEIIRVPVE